MKTPTALLVFALALTVPVHAEDDAAATGLLERVDRILRPDDSFAVTVRATTFKNREASGSLTLRAFVRVRKDSPSLDSLAVVTEPVAERGKVYLRKGGGELWFYDPRAKRPVRISAQQRLQGQASLDDFLSVNLKDDYTARMEADETVTDATGKARTCQRLRLTARTKTAAYPSIVLWVDRDNQQPVKGTSYAAAGRALRTAFYDKFRGLLGGARPTEISIVDEVHPNLITQIRFSDLDHRELPDGMFHEGAMPDAAGLVKD